MLDHSIFRLCSDIRNPGRVDCHSNGNRSTSQVSLFLCSDSTNRRNSLLGGPLCVNPTGRRNLVGAASYSLETSAYDVAASEPPTHVAEEKVGVLLLNLGGPETLNDVQPFLFNLFADPVCKVCLFFLRLVILFCLCKSHISTSTFI